MFSYLLCLLAVLAPIFAVLSPASADLSVVSAALSPVPVVLSPALENGEVKIVSPLASLLTADKSLAISDNLFGETLNIWDDSDSEFDEVPIFSDASDSEFEEIVVPGPSFFAPSLAELLTPGTSAARISPLSVGEATRICRSPAWALTPENWIFSGAKGFLDAYTVATDGAYARQKYGLVGSLAYHYLGEENFRCSIGTMQTCVVSCKDVVMAVEDLEEAQLVYFILSSVSHFAAVADLVHVSISSVSNFVLYINANYLVASGCPRHCSKQCRTHGTQDGVLVFLAS